MSYWNMTRKKIQAEERVSNYYVAYKQANHQAFWGQLDPEAMAACLLIVA